MSKRSRRHRNKPRPALTLKEQLKHLLSPVFRQLTPLSPAQARDTCRKWLREPMLILDIEANGARHASEIVEIALINTAGETVYHSLVRAGKACSPYAFAVHGIEERELALAPCFEDVWPAVRSLLLSHPIISFDIRSDLAFLIQTLAQHELMDAALGELQIQCAMQLYRAFRESPQCVGLQQACLDMGISERQRHRAVDDCQLTLALMQKIAAVA